MKKTLLLVFLLPSLAFAQTKIKSTVVTRWTGSGTSTDDAFRPLVGEFAGITSAEDLTGVVVTTGGRNDIFVVSIDADSTVIDQIDADTTFFVISQERGNGVSRNSKGKANGLSIVEQNRLRQYLLSRSFSPADFNFTHTRGRIANQIVDAIRTKKGIKRPNK